MKTTAQPQNHGSAKTDAEFQSDVVRGSVRLGGEVVVVEVTMVHGGKGVTTLVDRVTTPWSVGSAAEQR